MDIYFIRHGDPDYEHDSLTQMGHFQAEKTSEELVKIPFDLIFSSSMNRAIETAKHLTNKTNQPIISFDWAREDRTWNSFHDVDDNGKGRWFFDIKCNQDKLSKLIGNKKWYEEFPSRYKELLVEDGKEIDKWLLSLGILHKDGKYKIIGKTHGKAAFFAHGGFGLIFYSHMLDLDYPSVLVKYGQQELCGVAHFKITDDGIKLISHSQTFY